MSRCKDLVGTMWRVKKATKMMAILPRPMMYCDWINLDLDVPSNWFLKNGDIIVLLSSKVFGPDTPSFKDRDWISSRDSRFQTFFQVALPVQGFINSTYFNKDSWWIERVG